jgi:hypothetical protein
MKFLKTYKLFEKYDNDKDEDDFNIGDYIKINYNELLDPPTIEFCKKGVFGKIIDINNKNYDDYKFTVQFFENVPRLFPNHILRGVEKYEAILPKRKLEKPNEIELDNYLKKHLSEDEYEKFLINKKATKYNIL